MATTNRPQLETVPTMEPQEFDNDTQVVTTTATKDTKDDKKEEEDEVPDLGGLKRLKKEYGSEFGQYQIYGGLASLGAGAMMPLFAVIFAEIIRILEDAVDDNGNSTFAEESTRAMLYFIGMGIGCLVFNVLMYLFWGIYGSRLATQVRQRYFEALMRQEIGFHEIETSSKINARLTTECFAIQEAVGTKFGFLMQTLAQFFIGIIFAFVYSWELTLVLFGTMPAVVILGSINGKLMQGSVGGKDADPFVNAGAFSQEVLTNIRTVLAFPTLINAKLKEYGELIEIASPLAAKKSTYIGVGLGIFMGSMFAICYSVGLFAGAVFFNEGYISVSQLFGAYFGFIVGGMGLGQIGSIAGDLKDGEKAANKFFQLIERVPALRTCEKKGGPIVVNEKNKLDGSVELERVVFAYPAAPDNEVLKGVTISIESGKTLAIVGPSGSGKSTIIGLLERFYDPKEGEIRVGGELIHNYDLASLRGQIGLVSQMPLLFDATIRENIKGGNNDATEEEIISAAKLANAHDFIQNLDKGYETSVGELGGRLSGGQRQRICIARAIVKVPSILLLDEATSALDTKSEREVQEALDKITRELNLTTIVIAHRLSTIKDADKIMVLVDGTVEEVGDHEELINANGVYAALVASQSLIEVSKEQHSQHKQEYAEKRDSQMNVLEGTSNDNNQSTS